MQVHGTVPTPLHFPKLKVWQELLLQAQSQAQGNALAYLPA